MMKEIRGVLVDVYTTMSASAVTIEDNLATYYEILHCQCIDIASRKIGKHYYDIYCDDEGLMKCHPIVSAFDKDNSPALVGNLFVCKTDEEGEAESLTQEEIDEILHTVKKAYHPVKDTWYDLIQVDYRQR